MPPKSKFLSLIGDLQGLFLAGPGGDPGFRQDLGRPLAGFPDIPDFHAPHFNREILRNQKDAGNGGGILRNSSLLTSICGKDYLLYARGSVDADLFRKAGILRQSCNLPWSVPDPPKVAPLVDAGGSEF